MKMCKEIQRDTPHAPKINFNGGGGGGGGGEGHTNSSLPTPYEASSSSPSLSSATLHFPHPPTLPLNPLSSHLQVVCVQSGGRRELPGRLITIRAHQQPCLQAAGQLRVLHPLEQPFDCCLRRTAHRAGEASVPPG